MDRMPPSVTGIILTLSVALLGGCQTANTQDELAALRLENQQLRHAQAQTNAAFQSSEAARAQYASNQQAYQSQHASLSAEVQQLRQSNAQLQAELRAKSTQQDPVIRVNSSFSTIEGVEQIQRADGIGVRIPGDVLFNPGKVTLKSTAKRTLDRIATVLKREYGAQTIRIEGYTDTDPIKKSPWKDNLELSLQRSAAVCRYLQSRGLNAKQMYAAGFGPHAPQSTKAKSRRVEIVVVGS